MRMGFERQKSLPGTDIVKAKPLKMIKRKRDQHNARNKIGIAA